MDSELSQEIEVRVGMLQGSVLSTFLFVVVIDVVTEFAMEGALYELLYAYGLFVMCETMNGLVVSFLNGRRLLRARDHKLTLGKPR